MPVSRYVGFYFLLWLNQYWLTDGQNLKVWRKSSPPCLLVVIRCIALSWSEAQTFKSRDEHSLVLWLVLSLGFGGFFFFIFFLLFFKIIFIFLFTSNAIVVPGAIFIGIIPHFFNSLLSKPKKRMTQNPSKLVPKVPVWEWEGPRDTTKKWKEKNRERKVKADKRESRYWNDEWI